MLAWRPIQGMTKNTDRQANPAALNLIDVIADIRRTLSVKLEYERRMHLSSAGHESSELRTRAQEALRKSPDEEVHQMFLRAVQLHPPGDQGEAASAAYYDLGQSFGRRRIGPHVENLLQAEHWYRASLACPVRDSDPIRAALTRDGLASCLRQLAQQASQRFRKTQLLEEAEALGRRAVEIAVSAGPLGLADAASYMNTLANLLKQQGRIQDAIAIFDEAEHCIEQLFRIRNLIEESLKSPVRQILSREDFMQLGGFFWEFLQDVEQGQNIYLVMINAAHCRAMRNQGDDRKRAIRSLEKVISKSPTRWVHHARLYLAEVLLRSGNQADRENAQKQLHGVSQQQLSEEQYRWLANLYDRAGLHDAALTICYEQINRAHDARTETLSDHAADEASFSAQQYGALAARILAKKGEVVKAFLTLERTVGARFEEEFGRFVKQQLQHPVARYLAEINGVYHSATLQLDEFAGRAARFQSLSPKDLEQFLSEGLASFKNAHLPTELNNETNQTVAELLKNVLVTAFEAAKASPDAVQVLRKHASQALRHTLKIGQAIRKIEPESVDESDSPFPYLSEADLRSLLKEHPDHCLIRFSKTDDLLVISVCLEKGKLVGKSLRRSLPRDWAKLLEAVHDDPKQADHAALTRLVEGIDLSLVIPARKMRRAVLLPSLLSSHLPLAVLGPPGKTLLDRFDSIIWMPTLAPLRRRPQPQPPRLGSLTVMPGGSLSNPTQLHEQALALTLPTEKRLAERAATLEAVRREAATVDIVTFYTHGQHHGQHGPQLELCGKPFEWQDVPRFAGAERVELWACQTGVNSPTDWVDFQGVDEDFGLDIDFLRHGVRSAIGSLWAVPELVTASLVRRYRRALLDGEDAATALATAQRAWRDDLLPSLLRELESGGAVQDVLRRFWGSLGETEPTQVVELAAVLGPVPVAGAPSWRETLDRLRLMMACPTSWAGFRFVGVPDFRPSVPWSPDLHRPPTEEEKAEANRILDEIRDNAEGSDTDLSGADTHSFVAGSEGSERDIYPPEQEHLLQSWQEEAESSGLTVDRAQKVARLYHDRISASHAHNLLLGLAWLHEALVTLNLTEEQRDTLSIDAAHLWLELASNEVVFPEQYLFLPPNRVALSRAAHLLEAIKAPAKDTANSVAASARLSFLLGLPSKSKGPSELRAAVANALPDIRRVASESLPRSYENVRALNVICSLLLTDPTLLKDEKPLTRQLRERIQEILPGNAESPEWVNFQRLQANQRSIIRATEKGDRTPIVTCMDLTPAERVRATMEDLRKTVKLGPEAAETNFTILSENLSVLEQSCWGAPSDQRTGLWHNTGTPGFAYRTLLGMFLGDHPEKVHATHMLTCLQQACDLRVAAINRLVRLLLPMAPNANSSLHWLRDVVLLREAMIQALADAALLPNISDKPKHEAQTQGSVEPHRVDPFKLSAEEMQSECRSPGDMTAWTLGHHISAPSIEMSRCRTAAFKTARLAARITHEIDKTWREGLKRSAEATQKLPADMARFADIATQLDPGIRIQDCEEWLQRIPSGHAILGLMSGPASNVLACCVWRNSHGLQQQTYASTPMQAMSSGLASLFHEIKDIQEPRGMAGLRASNWLSVRDALSTVLKPVLGPALRQKERLRLGILAPGSLRLLPMVGAMVGAMDLLDCVDTVVHLPALRFGDVYLAPPQDDGRTACLFADEWGSSELVFGRAALATLRRAFPSLILDPREYKGKRVVELDTIKEHAQQIQSLRLYGQGSVLALNPTTAHIQLAGERGLGTINVVDLLPACDAVELWACTSGPSISEVEYVLRNHCDRLPGLVPHFLTCGARGVLDLAWPVHDLVKALVCERYGLVRRISASSGQRALVEALRWTRRLLSDWQAARAELISLPAALCWLDEARRAAVVALGGDPQVIEPYRKALDYSPTLATTSVQELLTEVCQPCHLAAFRYWGAIE